MNYPAAIAPLIQSPPLAELGPGVPNKAHFATLSALTPDIVIPHHHEHSKAMACLSGLWLLHGFLDESHRISQELNDPTGSFWHAIMHRREPDPSNSKYWWRRVGDHPVLDLLRSEALKIGFSYRTPEEFVNHCERVRGTRSADEDLAKRVQMLEWTLLFEWCWTKGSRPIT
jgi:hypothetical protein